MTEVRQLTGWALRRDVSLVDGGDVDQIVVTAAFEAIGHAVGHRRAWPIASILRRTHRLVVREARAVDRWYARVLLDDAPERSAVEADPMEADPRRERRQLLATAAIDGVLTRSDVQLVWMSRVAGYQPAELAERFGASAVCLRQRRCRAERHLAAQAVAA